MNQERLQYLLDRYRSEQCDEDELAELNEWYHSLKYSPADFHQWLEEASGEKALAEQLYSNFSNRTAPRKKKLIWQITAAALVIILAGAALLYKTRVDQPGGFAVQSAIKPGTNKAILTLADGSQITLDDAIDGKIASQQGINVTKSANGQLTYDFSGDQQGDETVFNTLYTPKGGQYAVILPDGTKAWLNSDSRLTFPVVFSRKERKISLTGEAYFEVRHLKDIPFIITTGNQAIEVLGTHFNVNGYEDEQAIHTTLLEGSVKVRNILTQQEQLLVPGQQSSFNRNKGNIAIRKANTEEVMAWKNGYFLFDDQDLPGILRAISRWYDVEIEYQYTGKYEKFGGTFSRSSELQDILNNLQELGAVHFNIANRKIIVTK